MSELSNNIVEVKPIDCPHCKKAIEVEIERKPAKVIIERAESPKLDVKDLDAAVERILDTKFKRDNINEREPKATEQKNNKDNEPDVPDYLPKYQCKGCGGLHTNKKFKGLPVGRCDTCGEKFKNKRAGKCPFCKEGEIEELTDSDIEDMGLYLPDLEELGHNHNDRD